MIKAADSIFTSKSVKVGDYTIGVRSNGSDNSRTIILVHGIGVSEKYFRRLAGELSAQYNVISINLPGYGDTQRPPHPLNLDELAGVLARFIRQEDATQPIIIGQSMGCQIIARLASENVQLAEKFILISPTINIKERIAPLQFLRLMQDALREPLSMNLMMLSDYMKFGAWRYLITQRYMIADKIEESLSHCAQPVLLVRGGRDKIVPHQWVTFLLQTLKSGSLFEVSDGPHNLQYTHPKELAKACIDFIEA